VKPRRGLGCGHAVLALALAGAPAMAGAIEGYPGDTWGRVSHELDRNTGTGISFFVNQGIDWAELPGGIMLNTFAEYRYSRRTRDPAYFDAEGEAVGVDLRRSPFHAGVEWFREDQTALNTTQTVTRAYFTWYGDWYKYLRRRLEEGEGGLHPISLSGSTWGRVRRELDRTEYTTVQFFINQGVDWFQLPGDITFNTYFEPRFSYRSRDADYYNSLGPAIGMELQRSPFKLGTDYYWEYFTERKVWDRTWRLYLTWYYNWRLEDLGRGD
jgi:hypothetical protein